jgi:hypothetical protein
MGRNKTRIAIGRKRNALAPCSATGNLAPDQILAALQLRFGDGPHYIA